MPRVIIEGETQEDMIDTLINLGVAAAQSRQVMLSQQKENAEKAKQKEAQTKAEKAG